MPRPASGPLPLWQAAAALDPSVRKQTLEVRGSLISAPDHHASQNALYRAGRADDRGRLVLAIAVVGVAVLGAGIALWLVRSTRTVYVPISAEPAASSVIRITAPAPRRAEHTAPPSVAEFVSPARRGPIAAEGVVGGNPNGTAVRAAAPALPQTWTPPPAFAAPALVDHAARDQQIEDIKSRIETLDEEVRCVREHPTDSCYYWHYYSSTYHGIDQARRDTYLKDLDKQRNDLRRQKWTLEGR